MPVACVTRAGVRPAPREVPTDTPLAVLPMTFDRVGEKAVEDERLTRVSSLAEAFVQPRLDFRRPVERTLERLVVSGPSRSIIAGDAAPGPTVWIFRDGEDGGTSGRGGADPRGRGRRRRGGGRRVRALIAVVALTLLWPAPAEARWPIRRTQEPAPPAPAAQPAAAPAAPTPEQIQAEEKQRLLRDARARDFARQVTVQNAEERLMAWGLVRAIDPGDAEALRGYDQARRDVDAAKKLEESARTRAADAETRKEVRTRLREANAAFDAGQLDQADRAVEEVLATSPEDPQALSLRSAVAERRRSLEFRRLLLTVGAFFGLSATVIFYMAWRAMRERAARRGEEGSGGAAPRALLKVVDGVARGRLVPLQAEVFRIGSAQGEGAGEQNDLVISDSAALVSRYHCAIIRKGKKYLLIDSSLNGTELNGAPLERGEHHVLRDGDEFVLARAARVKFLVT